MRSGAASEMLWSATRCWSQHPITCMADGGVELTDDTILVETLWYCVEALVSFAVEVVLSNP
jgi:hypothetical protein